ncbi:MAG: hypothetical protein VYD19_08285 [Myxococcota bacterium]|nr:hypothetical protein [Myxococcota bacterium]
MKSALFITCSLSLLSIIWTPASACTSYFHAPSGIMVKSYDWKDGAGLLAYHPAGRSRIAFRGRDPGTPHSWRARYASLSFDQYGVGFSNGGINEAGLAVEVLWLKETEHPTPDHRPYLNELEWVRYHLETAATVKALVQSARAVRVSSIHGKVHYFACDQGGDCAALEYLNGALKVHRGAELPVPALTNHSYQASLDFISGFQSFGGSKAWLSDQKRGSLPRFLQAARATQHQASLDMDGALRQLGRVQVHGYTKWQNSYALRARQVSLKQAGITGQRSVGLESLIALNPACEQQLVYRLEEEVVGDLSGAFRSIGAEENRKRLRARFAQLELPLQIADQLAAHKPSCGVTP